MKIKSIISILVILVIGIIILSCKQYFFWGKNTDFVVLPHHNLTYQALDSYYEKLWEKKYKNIVIISPNHFATGNNKMQSFQYNAKYCFQKFCVNGKKFPDYKQAEFQFDFSTKVDKNTYKIYEHWVGTHFEYISKYMPKTDVYALVVQREYSDFSNAENVINFFEQQVFNSNTLFIASVDFSHHVEENFAKIHDYKTVFEMTNGNFENLEVDCASCLYIQKKLADNYWKKYFSFTNRTSVNTLLSKNTNNENTSHIFWEYVSQKPQNNFAVLDDYISVGLDKNFASWGLVTGMFFWDFNFADRWYAEIVRREKATPQELLDIFAKEEKSELFWNKYIHTKLSSFDFVSANLETSVYNNVNDCQYSQKNIVLKTQDKYLKYFKQIWISHVSLANNHSYDCGEIWFEATKKYLSENNISYFWDGRKKESNILLQEINGQKIAFVWFNDTSYQVDWDNKYKKIRELHDEDYFIIVNIHWGNEYETQNNSRQKFLAEKFVENWADLIIWHHPHVVQNYEIIDWVPVFYSLGNFFFDQPMQETLKWMWVFFVLEWNMLKIKPIYLYRDSKFMKIQYFSNQ